ncbi:RRQRL motif-containing zinc-binding protein [Streptomyces sp. NPDC059853]|uniref:RRQRL motif-containing zinc-binding protein n=1 Tax=Streptomyces sp. NPDC059853 TaxID=3346973 RepID=UPI003648F3E6
MSTLPTYAPRCAPDGLMTRRQLRAAGLRPGGADPVAQIVWPRSGRWAALYSVADARPVRPMTPGRWHAVAAMMIARSTCPRCHQVRDHYYSQRLGCCGPCAADLEQAA